MDNINTIRELQSLGVTVLFEQEGIDTGTITSETMVTLYSCLPNKNLSASQNEKGQRVRMEKVSLPSNPPYGYRLIEKQLEVYEPEAM